MDSADSRPPSQAIFKTIGYFGAYVTLGAAIASLGPSLPYLAENVGVSLGEIGFLFSARSLGYLLGSLAGGKAYDRFPAHRVLVLLLLTASAGLAFTPMAAHLWLLAGLMLATGLALGGIDVGSNTLLAWVHGSRSRPYLNAMFFFAGVGSFLAPQLIGRAVLAGAGLRWPYWVLSALALLASLWVISQPSPRPAGGREDEAGTPNPPLRVAGFAVLFFLYVGTETSFGGWIYSYVLRQGLGAEAAASGLTSAFWMAITLGRLAAIPISARLSRRTYISLSLAGALLSLSLLLLMPDSLNAAWGASAGLGLSISALFPTTFSLAERQLHLTGSLSGWLWASGSTGAITLPWLTGKAIESVAPGALGVILLASCGLYLLVFLALANTKPLQRQEAA